MSAGFQRWNRTGTTALARGDRTAPRRRHPGAAWLLVAALAAALLPLVAATPPADAAVTHPFARRFSADTNGDIMLRGNTLASCNPNTAGCPGVLDGTVSTGSTTNNNNWTMQWVDIDGDPTTTSSSSAAVSLSSNASVLWAGLYWSAYYTGGGPAGTAMNQLKFKTPASASYQTLTATTVDDNTANKSYQSFADVTSLLRAGGSGTYTGANIFGTVGSTDKYAGWALVIAYYDPDLAIRNLTVFDGFGVVQATPSSDRTVDLAVSGFRTPPAGTVNTRMGAVVFEGDRGLTGDSFDLVRQDGTVYNVTDALNPIDNDFNSTIGDNGVNVAGRTPNYQNTLGLDEDIYQGTNLLQNNNTRATLRLRTLAGGETFYPGVVTFAVDLYAPHLRAAKTATPVDVNNDGVIGADDEIDYSLQVTNDGFDVSEDTKLTDAIPLGTTYKANTLKVDTVSVTDASDGDRGEASANDLKVRLGAGAGGSGGTGGTINVAGVTTVTYTVTIARTNQFDARVVNGANLTYTGQQTGIAMANSSDVVITAATIQRADLRVTGTATPAIVQRDGSRAVTWKLLTVNDGPTDEPAATLTATLPAGTTGIGVPGGCSTAGVTVTCGPVAMNAGASGSRTITGTLAAGVGDPAVLHAVIAGGGQRLDPVPANDTADVSTPVNTPPGAADDALTLASGGTGTVNLLANDTDADGDPLTVVSVTSGSTGATVNASGVLTATAPPGFKGVQNVPYRVCDGRGGCTDAQAMITVSNAAPTARDDGTGTTASAAIDIDVLANDVDVNPGDTLSITSVTQPDDGTSATSIVAGRVHFVPGGGAGTTTFTYQVCDDDSPTPACSTATVTVRTSASAPVASDDQRTTPFQTATVINDGALLANDTDPQNDVLTVLSAQAATNGTVTHDNNTHQVTFTPANGFVGVATFTYTITDGGSASTATVYVTVPDTAPAAVGDTVTVSGSVATVIDELANDSDAQTPNAGLQVSVVSLPAHGSVLVGGDGKLTYTPAGDGFKGADSLQYRICDPQGLCSTATVNLTVGNTGPTAVDDARNTLFNTMVSIPVLDNDADPNGDTLAVNAITTAPAHGTANIVGTAIQYTPTGGYRGTDSFVYRACDDNAPTPGCALATVRIDVGNRQPTAVADTGISAHSGVSPTVIDIPVLTNDTDPDGDPLTVTAVTAPATGTVTVVGGTTLRATTPGGFAGSQVVTYEISDGHGGAARAAVTFTVTNNLPSAADDTAAAGTHTATDLTVLANDSDPDGDPLHVGAITTAPAHGTATIVPDNTTVNNVVRYTPAVGYSGPDTFVYTACDPFGQCASATVTITTTNHAPDAVDDAFDLHYNALVTAIGVLGNDTDTDTGDTLTGPTVIAPAATHGTVSVNGSNQILYTVTPGTPVGTTDQIHYQLCDSLNACDTATLTITVTNTTPVAVADADTAVVGVLKAVDVRSNDTDADGDTLAPPTIFTPPNPAQATAAVNGTTGDIEVTVLPGVAIGTQIPLTYRVCDPAGACANAVLTITVGNSTPTAVDDAANVHYDGTVDTEVRTNDVDPDTADVLAAPSVVVAPQHGTASVNPDGTIHYTVTAGRPVGSTDTLTYQVCDPGNGCDTAVLTITVTDAAPVANPDSLNVHFDAPATTIDARGNDTDADNDTLTAAVIGPPAAHGAATINGSGQVSYAVTTGTPVGTTDVVHYRVCDPAGQCSDSVVNVTVTNTLPVAGDDPVNVHYDRLTPVDVRSNDTDADGDPLDPPTIVTGPTKGIAVVNGGTGNIDYTPAAGTAVGQTDAITYSVCDPAGGCAQAQVLVTITNTAPNAVDDTASAAISTPATIDVRGNDTDPDGDTLLPPTVTGPPPAHGNVLVDGNGDLVYTAAGGTPIGTVDTIHYSVCDPAGGCASAQVTVNIGNSLPIAGDDAATTHYNTPVTVDVRADDVDPDAGDTLGAPTITVQPAHGTAVVDSAGDVVYVPANGTAAGTVDQLTYRVCDPGNGCDTAVLSITITNTAPVADDDPVNVHFDTDTTVDVRAGDTDADGDTILAPTVVGPPAAHGTAIVVSGDIRYAPTPGTPVGTTDTVHYQVCDPAGGCDTADVLVTITDTAPVANDDSADATVTAQISVDVRGNDSDPDVGDTLSPPTVVTPLATHGTASVDALTGNLLYTADAGTAVGTVDNVRYQTCDPGGRCDRAILAITITNSLPIAVDDLTTTHYDTPTAYDVRANDHDPDTADALDPPTITAQPAHGTASVNGSGDVVYTPTAGTPVGTVDVIGYQVCDPGNGCDTAQLSVTVTDTAPAIADEQVNTHYDTAVTVDVRSNDTDPDGDTLGTPVLIAPFATHGSASVDGNGDIRYTPTPGTTVGTVDHVTYRVCDPGNGCDTATLDVTVTNGTPVANDDLAAATVGVAVPVDVRANDTDPDGDVLLAPVVLTGPAHGSAIVNGLGRLVYTAAAGTPIGTVDTVVYRVCDAAGGCDQATLSVTVTNSTPTAVADTVNTHWNRSATIDVRANDLDPDTADALGPPTVTVQPAHGTATVNGAGDVVYTPVPGTPVGTVDTLTYQICDPGNGCATAQVTVTVTNGLPSLVDDPVATHFDVPVTVDVTANDSDPDGDALGSPTITVPPANGTATVDGQGRIVYTPDAGTPVGTTDTFTYRVCDAAGGCATATLSVSIGDAAPVAVGDLATTHYDTPTTIDVRANDTDADSDPLGAPAITVPPAHGTAVVTSDGRIRYTPATGTPAGTADTLTYQVCDPGNACATAQVSITVTNTAPAVTDDVTSTHFDTAKPVNVRANDTDPDGDVLGAPTITVPPAHGTAVVNGAGNLVYSPTPGTPAGTVDTVTYQVCDPAGACDTATLTVTISNHQPTVVPDTGSTDVTTPITLDVRANDGDADGDPLGLPTVVTPPAHGTATVDGQGRILYTPANGTPVGTVDAFTYQVCDPAGDCGTATVGVSIGDALPVAADDIRGTHYDTPTTVDVRVNDSDPDGDPLTVPVIVSGPSHGSATVNSAGGIVYVPDDGTPVGTVDSVTYRICDPSNACDLGVLSVSVTNNPPVALPDDVGTHWNTATAIDVRGNDTDADGDPLLPPTVASSPAHGSATVNGAGDLVYAPAPGTPPGTVDNFDYEVCDDTGGCTTGTITVTVTNTAPVIVADTTSAHYDTPVTVDVRANDSDADGDPLLAPVITGQPLHGTATVTSDGKITYTPATGTPVGTTDTVTFQVCDEVGGCATGTLTLTVDNAAPVLVPDTATVHPGGSVTVDVQANDSDPDGDPLPDPVITAGPAHGTATVNGAGEIVYTPDPGTPGGTTDTITYQVCDAGGGCQTADVTITVGNGAPTAVDDTSSTHYDEPVTVDVRANDADPDGDQLNSPAIAVPPTHGTATVNGAGELVYTPAAGTPVGTVDTIVYQVCDPQNGCGTAVVSITITNGIPVARADQATTHGHNAVSVDVRANDSDPDDDALGEPVITIPPKHGHATVAANGTVAYLPSEDASAGTVDRLRYRVCDPAGGCSTAVLTVTVAGVAPVAQDDEGTAAPGESTTIDVTGNDTDADGDTLLAPVIITQPEHGTATVDAQGNIVYTPDEDAVPGTVDHITYRLCDDTGECTTATVEVTVSGSSTATSSTTTPDGDTLPNTGFRLLPWAVGGLLFILAGLGLLVWSHRRRLAGGRHEIT